MGRRSFTVRDMTEILMHWQAGRSIRQIARSLGVDRSSIRKYVRLARSLGYRPQQTNPSASSPVPASQAQAGQALSAAEWASVLQAHTSELGGLAQRSAVFAEIMPPSGKRDR